jgi:quaternary ammonium compound-resistance protein SugE
MAWFVLILAGLFEIGWAMRTLPVGTAYAVWTGIGAVGTVVLGVILFDDPMTPLRLASIGLIIAGLVGLKMAT